MNTSEKHPCFNRAAAGSYGRVHLPVAPKCNIQCRYCNRKYNCVNESRPGVTATVLSPNGAAAYMDTVLEKEPRISVAGIAGPGDPMANPAETLTTMRLIRRKYPSMIFCLSTNGFAFPEYAQEVAGVGVSHLTVTLNAVDPTIGEKIYSRVRDGNVVYQGLQAAEYLLSRQLQSIKIAKDLGLTVKVNTIIIPGINDTHVEDVAQVAAHLGADIMNCLPIHPVAETEFADIEEPDALFMRPVRARAEAYIPQMKHCKRCRADAVGLLCNDRSGEMREALQACAAGADPKAKENDENKCEDKPYVAVASKEGMLINKHLGETSRFQIWSREAGEFRMLEERKAPAPGCGPKRWEELACILQDCRAVLVSAYGESPAEVLEAKGIRIHACAGFIQSALEAVYGDADLSVLQGRKRGIAGSCCSGGDGRGCA